MPTVDLVPMTHGDLELVVSWIKQPHVRRWWRDPEPLEPNFQRCLDGEDPTQLWIIRVSEQPTST